MDSNATEEYSWAEIMQPEFALRQKFKSLVELNLSLLSRSERRLKFSSTR